MGVLRTNDDGFEDQANANSFVTDQYYKFSISERGSSIYYPIIPRNYGYSQIIDNMLFHTVSSTDTDIGIVQLFQATAIDNISGFKFVAQGSHNNTEETELLDDFEYASDTELTDVWTTNNGNHEDNNIYLSFNDSDEMTGNYCAEAYVYSRAEGNYFRKNFAEDQDWSDVISVNFNWMASKDGAGYSWKLILTDDIGQEACYNFNSISRWTYESKSFPKALFVNSNVFNWGAVRNIKFYCHAVSCNYMIYIDTLSLTRNIKHTKLNVEVSLVHFGPTFDPAALGEVVTLDDNFDSVDALLEVDTKQITQCNLSYGAIRNDWKLVAGDYYGLVIKKPTDGTVNFYGSATQTFAHGTYDIKSDSSLELLSGSLACMICTASDSTLKSLHIRQDVYAPKSNINLLLVDPVDFTIRRFLGIYSFESGESIEISYDYSNPEIIKLLDTSHLYIYYQDSFDSEATTLHVCARLHYDEIGI